MIPIAHNSGSFWPARQMLIKRQGTIQIRIGEAIDPRGMTPEELNEKVKTWIDATVVELERSASFVTLGGDFVEIVAGEYALLPLPAAGSGAGGPARRWSCPAGSRRRGCPCAALAKKLQKEWKE